jgi:hypothetical protein
MKNPIDFIARLSLNIDIQLASEYTGNIITMVFLLPSISGKKDVIAPVMNPKK